MAEPDIRVDPTDLDAAGAELVRAGSEVADVARAAAALTPDPAWSEGFGSVAAGARLGALWREALEHRGDDVAACGTAMRAAAAAWRATDDEVAASLRAG